MKQLVVGTVAIVSALALSSVTLAQQQPASAPAPAASSATPEAKPAAPAAKPAPKPAAKAAAKTHKFAGAVVAVDAEAKTVTVKRGGAKPEEQTFAVDDAAVAAMKGIKAGDSITVSYLEADGKLIAKKLAKPAAKTAAKKQP